MRLTLKNLGRLEEATIDLGNDLIVLTGPNNTSKTYVAHAIYGFCSELGTAAYGGVAYEFITQAIPLPAVRKAPKSTTAPSRPAVRKAPKSIAVNILDIFDTYAIKILKGLGRNYQTKLADVFATSKDFFSQARILLDAKPAELARARRFLSDQEFHSPPTLETFGIEKTAGSDECFFADVLPPLVQPPPSHEPRYYLSTVGFARISVTRILLDALFPDLAVPHVLTAERSAIQLFSRELSFRRNDMLDAVLKVTGEATPETVSAEDPLAILRQRARRYPLAIRKGLRDADDLATLKNSTSPYADEANRFERDILGGAIQVGADSEMTFLPSPGSSSLTMHLASSSVKALSALGFYLRHLAAKGQFLIIDEPELNLHPTNQRKVARLLARLARAGIKVMISTHSDYIIRELNNLIMLSADTDGKLREKYGYYEEETLSPERVGAYAFDGTHAHILPIERAGIPVAAIDQEIREQNRSSRDIYYSLFDRDET